MAVLRATHLDYMVEPDSSSSNFIIIDRVSGRDGSQSAAQNSTISFVDGTGYLDSTGAAEQVARLYKAAFGRAPDANGLVYWTNLLNNHAFTLNGISAQFVSSSEFSSKYGTLANAAFVAQLYVNVLGRASDASGAAYWTGLMNGGTSAAVVLAGMSESFENKVGTSATIGAGDLAEAFRLYQAAFNRMPDTTGWQYWTQQLDNGQTPLQVAQGFASAAEFTSQYNGLSASAIVGRLYQNVLHRAGDSGGIVYWTGLLNAGTSLAQLLLGFADSAENRQATAGATHDGWVFLSSAGTARIYQTTETQTPSTAELALWNSQVGYTTLQFAGGTQGLVNSNLPSYTAQFDASKISAFSTFDIAATGSVAITNLSNGQHVSDSTGITSYSMMTLAMAGGANTTLNLDLTSNFSPGARWLGSSTFGQPGVGLSGVKALNITSNSIVTGSGLTNLIAGFYAAGAGDSVDGIQVTITGSGNLQLGATSGDGHSFRGVSAVGETIDARQFKGSLTYISSGKGDTIYSGSGANSYFAVANDRILTGFGTDTIHLSTGNYTSSTASDITFIVNFAPGSDTIAVGSTGNAAAAMFDDRARSLDGYATLAAAAQHSFVDYVAFTATPESAGAVVEFAYQGMVYDAISMDGNFGLGGYVNASTQAVKELIVGLGPSAGTETRSNVLF